MKRVGLAVCVSVSIVCFASGCKHKADEETRFTIARKAMVDSLATSHALSDKALIAAFAETPRQKFVTADSEAQAYQDAPLAADRLRWTPAPTACAMALQALQLRPGVTVLQLGPDDGYRPAVMSHIARNVYVMVLNEASAAALKQELANAGVGNVSVKAGDTAQGWAEHGPYDAILADCDPGHLPDGLADQLKPNGHLVTMRGPVAKELQVLTRDKRRQEMTLAATVPIPQGAFQSTASVPVR